MVGVIYCWRNKENGKRYIGQTINEEERKKKHIQESQKKYGNLGAFHTALRLHGVDAFEYSVLCRVEKETKGELTLLLNQKEERYIRKYKSCLTDYGYNSTYDGQYKGLLFSRSDNKNKRLRLGKRTEKEPKKENKVLVSRRMLKKEQKEKLKNVSKWYINKVSALCNALGVPMAIITCERSKILDL